MSIKYVESSKIPREAILKDKLTEHDQKIAKSQRCLIISSIVAVIFTALSVAVFVKTLGGPQSYIAIGTTSSVIVLVAISSVLFFLLKLNNLNTFSPKEILEKYLSIQITEKELNDFQLITNRERNKLIFEITPNSLENFICFIANPKQVKLKSKTQMLLFLEILDNLKNYSSVLPGQDRATRYQQIKEQLLKSKDAEHQELSSFFTAIESIQNNSETLYLCAGYFANCVEKS